MAARLNLDDFLCFSIYRAGQAFNQFYRPLLDGLGLTYPQYLVMVSLWMADGRTVGDICRSVSLESSTVTPVLKRLQAMGLVNRARHDEDERQVLVTLTEAGRALRGKASDVPACVEEALGLTAEEFRTAHSLLERIAGNLSDDHPAAASVRESES
jgi:DNA-binding MarR family transcriptional regulator